MTDDVRRALEATLALGTMRFARWLRDASPRLAAAADALDAAAIEVALRVHADQAFVDAVRAAAAASGPPN